MSLSVDQENLADNTPTSVGRVASLSRHDIGRIVTKTFGVSFDECCKLTRQRKFVRARWAAWVLMLEFKPGSSWQQLARVFSKDHTSVMNGIDQAERLLKYDADFAMLMGKARKAILNGGREADAEPCRAVSTVPPLVGAEKSVSPPAVKSVAPTPCLKRGLEAFDSGFEYDRWLRDSLKKSDARMRAAMMRAHPEYLQAAAEASE